MTNKKFPPLSKWKKSRDKYSWEESTEQGGRTYEICWTGALWHIEVIHEDGSVAYGSKQHTKPEQCIYEIRRSVFND